METIARRSNPVNSSGDLTIANARLHALREQMRQKRSGTTRTVSEISAETEAQSPAALPNHLGWGSDRIPVIAGNRHQEKPPKPRIQLEVVPDICESASQQVTDKRPKTVAVHPSLLAAFLKNEGAAIGRIWLLCRYLDKQGRGWLSVDELRTHLTDKSSPIRICGWRRLRQILQQGKGIFWERDDHDRLWLHGTARVAYNLELDHFEGAVIALPIGELLGNIGAVRAAFYSAFHCGRDATPLSRQTLQTITGVAERTQRHYDEAADTERITNISLVAPSGDKEAYWQHGRAAFRFIDKQGKQGIAGQAYTAVRLPNSYKSTRYARLDSNQKKRLNRQLRQDLVQRGTQGNSHGKGERLFFTDGKQAGRAFNRNKTVFLCDKLSGNTIFWSNWQQ